MNEWDNLPNAVHIDRVIASLKANPQIWDAAWRNCGVDRPGDQRGESRPLSAARQQRMLFAARVTCDTTAAARSAAWAAAATLGTTRAAAYYAACDAIAALITYDDSAKYLNLPLDQLKMLYALTEHPAYLLLQPAVQAFSMERGPA